MLAPGVSKAKLVAGRVFRTAAYVGSRRLTSSASEGLKNYDVVIIGGGPVGLALASALNASEVVRSTQSVALIEAGDLSKVKTWDMPHSAFSNRVSSITNTSYEFLSRSKVWEFVDTSRTNPIAAMQVWDGISDARIHFSSDSSSLPGAAPAQMATMTENLNLQRALLRALDFRPGLSVIDNMKVIEISSGDQTGDDWPILLLSDGRRIRARLLVGADGFNSPVKSYAKIPTFGWAYDTQAVVATLEHAPIPSFLGDNTTAFQRFLPTGPIAFLPLTPTVSSLVWSTKPALAKSLTQVEPQVLAGLINAAFRLPHISVNYLHDALLRSEKDGSGLSEAGVMEEIKFREAAHGINEQSPLFSSALPSSTQVVPPSGSHLYPPLVSFIQPRTVASFPLRFGHAETYLGEGAYSRTVLVGDAAHTIHPMAGQGLNMGLGDVGSLVDCIEKAAIYGGDIGSRTTLIPYARSRYLENHTILSAVDKLHKLYSTTSSPVVWARSVGLEVVNEMDTLKAAFMMSAGATTRTSSFGQLAGEGYGTAMKMLETAQTIARTVGGAAASTLVNILKNNEIRR